MSNNRGYTLVEMMAVIVLIGVLSASAASRFGGTGEIAERSYRAQMISETKYAQQRAMNDTALNSSGDKRARCYRFYSSGSIFGPQVQNAGSATWSYPNQKAGTEFPVTLNHNVSTTVESVYFDAFGNSIASCALSASLVSNEVVVTGETVVKFKVETTGYVHAI